MVRVIVNADDLGMSAGVNRGIVRAMGEGLATSATFMPSMPGSEDASSRIVALGLDVGVHLNVTQGRPLMGSKAVPSLAGSTGEFCSVGELRARLGRGAVAVGELELEFGRQIERTMEVGIKPTHLDTHHHVHASITVAKAVYRVAQRYGISKVRTLRALKTFTPTVFKNLDEREEARRARRLSIDTERMQDEIRMPAALLKPGEGVDDWIGMFEALAGCSDSTVVEVICHPAEADEELRQMSQFVASRETELTVLLSPDLRDAVSGLHIKLISYRDL